MKEPRGFAVCLPSALMLAAAVAMLAGCETKGRELAPVGGKVTYRGQPLKFGNVTFQPVSGQPSLGMIQPDGTFRLSTPGQGEVAVVGRNQVRITCLESQDPSRHSSDATGVALGKSLIPRKYSSYETSGLVVEVRSGENPPVVFDLKE